MRVEIGKGRNNNKGSFLEEFNWVADDFAEYYFVEINQRSCFYEYMIDSESDYFSVMENIMDRL